MSSVSVIMPCFNHAEFVADSVEAVLQQKVEKLELIVVDDHSLDGSHERLLSIARRDSRMKVLRNSCNQGVSSARNHGLQMATGEFIAFCDADDVWEAEKLAVQLESLASDARYGMAYSDSIVVDECGMPTGRRFSELHPLPEQPSGDMFHELCVRNFINTQTVVMRRACMPERMSFDRNIRFGEDWWFWIQLSYRCPFYYSSQPLARYRVHSRSTNFTQRKGYCRDRFKVYRRTLKSFPDLPPALAARIWYEMGCCLRGCGKHRSARKFFRRAFCKEIRHWDSVPHAARPLFRALWPGR